MAAALARSFLGDSGRQELSSLHKSYKLAASVVVLRRSYSSLFSLIYAQHWTKSRPVPSVRPASLPIDSSARAPSLGVSPPNERKCRSDIWSKLVSDVCGLLTDPLTDSDPHGFQDLRMIQETKTFTRQKNFRGGLV